MDEEIFDGFVSIEPNGEKEETAALISEIPACKGVILFADSEGNPIQLLIGANLRRTTRAKIAGHEEETVSKRPDIARIANRIYYKCCYNNFLSTLEHYRIAKELFPANYKDAVILPKLSLVKIDTAAKWPSFSVTSSIQKKQSSMGERKEFSPILPDAKTFNYDEKVFGPFTNRKSAGEFIGILEDAFSLCTRPDFVDNPEKAASCPYLQMGTCPAPCVGNISREQYLRQIDKAIIAASGHRSHLYTVMEKEMERFSENMEFESASEVKKKIKLLKKLDTETYEWTAELENMSILHIDKSAKIKEEGKRGKTQTFAAFYITAGKIQTLEPFTMENFEEFYKFISKLTAQSDINSVGRAHPTIQTANSLGRAHPTIQTANSVGRARPTIQAANSVGRAHPTIQEANEMLALVSYFLYRSNRAGIWIDLSKGIPAEDEIKGNI